MSNAEYIHKMSNEELGNFLTKEIQKYQWVSVEDRLPEKSGDYITADMTMRDGYVHELPYSAVYKKFNAYDYDTPKQAKKHEIIVTHWMPLPKPPEENEDEKCEY